MLRRLPAAKLCRLKQPTRPFFSAYSAMSFQQALPYIALSVGVVAFSFQVTILYPWHHELSRQLSDITLIVAEMKTQNGIIDHKLNEVKLKERRILEAEQTILNYEQAIMKKVDVISESLGSKHNT